MPGYYWGLSDGIVWGVLGSAAFAAILTITGYISIPGF